MSRAARTPEAAPPRRRPRRLWRWTRRIALAALVLLVAARIALPFVLPSIVDSVAAGFGLSARYEALELSILGGNLTLRRLQVAARPAEGGEAQAPADDPYLELEYAHVDVDVSALFGGTVRLHRVEVDGLDLLLERSTDGGIRFLEHFAPGPEAVAETGAPEAGAEPDTGPPDALALNLPVQIDGIRIQHTRARLVDRRTEPAVDTWVEAHVRITDLGRPDRPARIEITAQGPDLLDRLALLGSLSASERALEARFDLAVDGAHPGPAATWLRPLGLTPVARSLDARAEIRATLSVDEAAPHLLDAEVRIGGVALRADAAEEAAIDEILIQAADLEPARIQVPTITVDGVRGRATRLADGGLRLAGFELRPAPAANRAPPSAVPPAPPAEDAPATVLALDRLAVRAVALQLRDEAVEPAADLALLVDEIELADLVRDPARPDARAALRLSARAPGIAERLQLDAQLALFGIRKTAEAQLRVEQIGLGAIRAHLAAAGLEPTLENGSFTLHLIASAREDAGGGAATRAELAIDGIALRDGDAELLALDQVSITGLSATADRLAIGEVTVRGTRLPLRRSADGALHLAGLKTRAPSAVPTAPPEAPAEVESVPAPTPTSTADGPRIELQALRVRDTVLSFVDEGREPAIAASTTALELDLENLALGGPGSADAADEAQLRVRLRVPGVAEELGIRGPIRTRPGPLDLSAALTVTGDRLAAGPFTPYLLDLGIEPKLAAGRLRATLEARAKADGDGLLADLRLAECSFQDGDGPPFVALAELRVDELRIGAGGIHVGRVAIREPSLRAERAADGALLALGLRIAPPAAAGELPAPEEGTATAAPAEPQAAAPAAAGPTQPRPAFALETLELRGARFSFRDAALGPIPTETALTVDADLGGLSLAAGAAPARFALRARADGALDAATLDGSLSLDPDDLKAAFDLDARGLRAGPLAGYLPAGITPTLGDGRLRAAFAARFARAAAGGSAIELALTEVDFRDGDAAEPLFACDALRLAVPRFDPDGGAVLIDELRVAGTQLAARRLADGTTEVLGLAFAPPGARPPAPAAPEPRTADRDGSAQPAAAIDRGATPPRVSIQTLDIELARLRFEDLAGAGESPPVPLDARMRIFAPAPLVLLDAVPEALPEIELRLEAGAAPVCDSLVAVLGLAPWQPDPRLEASLLVEGLHGPALTEVLPSLAERIDGTNLPDGRLTATLEAEFSLRRRTPTDIDLSRGFGLRAEVREVAFRASPDGPVLAGIDEISIQVPRIAPDGSVQVTELDVSELTGRVRRTAEGIEALGLLIRNPAAAEPAPAEPAGATAAAPAGPAARTAAEPGPAAPEFRLDHLTVRGLDFVYQDDAADPPMTVPLDGLDLELSNFTTRAFAEPRPLRFSVAVTGGDVELQKRHAASSVVAGFLGAAVGAVTGRSNEIELEQRPMMDEISVNGRLTFHPELQGRIRASISALELTTFRGAANEAGVEIGDGVLDAGVQVDLLGAGGQTLNANFRFDSLQIDEPPGGPISTYLKLPAPLNSVLFALKDEGDQISIPLNVHVEESGVGGSQIANAAITALGSLITKAVAAAPFRVTGAVTGALGLDGLFGGDEIPLEERAVTIDFAPAATAVAPEQRRALEPLVELLQDDPQVGLVLVHSFGAADLARAAALANPSPDQTRALAARLRQRRDELGRTRATQGAEARVLLASAGPDEVQAAVLRLQALDRELGETEAALDRTLEMLRPGAERRADRRTRAAALEIGNLRLDAIRRALVEQLGPDGAERVEIRRARPTAAEGEGGGRVQAVPKVRRAG
jgi:hypothetical protein